MSYISQGPKNQSQFEEKKPQYYIPQSNHISNPFTQSQVNRERLIKNSQQILSQLNNEVSRYYTNGSSNEDVPQRSSSVNRFVSSQVTNQQIVKGESRIKYIPYEKKVVEYENRSYVEQVPITRKVVQYEERRVMETIPREVVQQNYYALEKRIQYHKQIIPEKRIEMVPVQRKIKKYQYVPVEKQIIHYPQNHDFQNPQKQSRVVLQSQGVYVKPDAQFRPINSNLIYSYSQVPENKYQPIGYVDQGYSRAFSNAPTYLSPSFIKNDQSSFIQGYNPSYIPHSHSGTRLSSIQGQIFTESRVRPQLYQQNQSYIKQLNKSNDANLKKPFEMLQKSNVQQYAPKQRQEQSTFTSKPLYNDYYKFYDPLNNKQTKN